MRTFVALDLPEDQTIAELHSGGDDLGKSEHRESQPSDPCTSSRRDVDLGQLGLTSISFMSL